MSIGLQCQEREKRMVPGSGAGHSEGHPDAQFYSCDRKRLIIIQVSNYSQSSNYKLSNNAFESNICKSSILERTSCVKQKLNKVRYATHINHYIKQLPLYSTSDQSKPLAACSTPQRQQFSLEKPPRPNYNSII